MITSITSPQNARIKQVVQLAKRNQRERLGRTLVEGGRELALALKSGVSPIEVFVCPPLLDESSEATSATCYDMAREGLLDVLEVPQEVYAKIAYRESVGGLVAVIPAFGRTLDELPSGGSPLVLAVESPEKPGNLGALLRTADAAGVAFVLVCGDGTDINNPNVVRASLGAVFTVPVAQTDSRTALSWLRTHGYRVVAASPDADLVYTNSDLGAPLAVAVGSEADGLSDVWLDGADERVRIPMLGAVDSLNLSVSTAILLYEAIRQQQQNESAAIPSA